MRGPVVAATAVAAVLVPGWAAAAPHTLTTSHIASGFASVSACGSLSGVSVSWTSRNGTVIKVVLSSIPSACNGGSLSLTFAAADNSSIGTAGPSVIAGTSLTLSTVTGAPTASSIAQTRISVVGP